MRRPFLAAALVGAALFGASAAQAGTHWSIGISLPVSGVVVSDGSYVEPAPVYYAPPPVAYVPAPRYVEREVYYAPAPRVVYEPAYGERRWERRGERWEDRWEERREHERREHWERDRDDGPRRWR